MATLGWGGVRRLSGSRPQRGFYGKFLRYRNIRDFNHGIHHGLSVGDRDRGRARSRWSSSSVRRDRPSNHWADHGADRSQDRGADLHSAVEGLRGPSPTADPGVVDGRCRLQATMVPESGMSWFDRRQGFGSAVQFSDLRLDRGSEPRVEQGTNNRRQSHPDRPPGQLSPHRSSRSRELFGRALVSRRTSQRCLPAVGGAEGERDSPRPFQRRLRRAHDLREFSRSGRHHRRKRGPQGPIDHPRTSGWRQPPRSTPRARGNETVDFVEQIGHQG